jgi:hypothetical protein
MSIKTTDNTQKKMDEGLWLILAYACLFLLLFRLWLRQRRNESQVSLNTHDAVAERIHPTAWKNIGRFGDLRFELR